MNLVLALALLSANDVDASQCREISVPLHRLACYEQWDRNRQKNTSVPAVLPEGAPEVEDDEIVTTPVRDTYVRFVVRNDASPFPNPRAEFGPKGASVVYERDKGEEYVSGNFSVMAIFNRNRSSEDFDEDSNVEWQPFALGQWKRSENADKKSDVRVAGVGLALVVTPDNYQTGTGFNIWPTIYRRVDIYNDADSEVASVHVDVIRNRWYSRNLDSVTENVYTFKPFFGVMGENRSESGVADGIWTSGYVGLEMTSRLNTITPRLEASVRWQYFSDFRSPDGADERNEDFGSFGLSYQFSDPTDKTIRWRPSISITREIGVNPLVGPDTVAETKVALTIQADTW